LSCASAAVALTSAAKARRSGMRIRQSFMGSLYITGVQHGIRQSGNGSPIAIA
jgi:hypothetical protein